MVDHQSGEVILGDFKYSSIQHLSGVVLLGGQGVALGFLEIVYSSSNLCM